jgi:hypothetical protein
MASVQKQTVILQLREPRLGRNLSVLSQRRIIGVNFYESVARADILNAELQFFAALAIATLTV